MYCVSKKAVAQATGYAGLSWAVVRIALALGFAAIAWAAHAQETSGSDLAPVPDVPSVSVSGAARMPAFSGTDPSAIRVLLSPDQETTLAAQMVGRIDAIHTRLGAPVKAGDTLVQFDCSEMQARLKVAQAELAGSRETYGVKQRLRKLEAAGDSEVTLARIDMDRNAAALDIAKTQLAYCQVKAPFDGRVVRLSVKPHHTVNVGEPLVELVSEGPLKLRMNVPSSLLRYVTVDSPVEVDILETGRTYPAKVSAVNARVDAVAQTIEVEAELTEAPAELLPGMSGVARLKEAS